MALLANAFTTSGCFSAKSLAPPRRPVSARPTARPVQNRSHLAVFFQGVNRRCPDISTIMSPRCHAAIIAGGCRFTISTVRVLYPSVSAPPAGCSGWWSKRYGDAFANEIFRFADSFLSTSASELPSFDASKKTSIGTVGWLPPLMGWNRGYRFGHRLSQRPHDAGSAVKLTPVHRRPLSLAKVLSA